MTRPLHSRPARGAEGQATSIVPLALAALAFLASATGCGGGPGDSASPRRGAPEELARDAAPSVVQVLVASPDGIRQGAGFVVDPRGTILTSGPLVEGARAVLVRLPSESSYYRGAVLARDAVHGTAVVGVEASGLPALELADTDVARLGAPVVAVGPDGPAHALVSGLDFDGYYSLQAPKPLPAALAGAPVLGEEGAVVGMVGRRVEDGRASSVIVPTAYVRDVLERSGAPLPEQAAERLASAPARSQPDQPQRIAAASERESAASRPAPAQPGPTRESAASGPASARPGPTPTPARPESSAGTHRAALETGRRAATGAAAVPATAAPSTAAPSTAAPSTAAPSAPSIPAPSARAPAASGPGVDLTGQWHLVNTIRRASYPPFEGLRLGFRVHLEQQGDRVVGRGEKWQENGRPIAPEARTPITIEGILKDGETLTATFVEEGERRTVRGSFRWNVEFDGRVLQGGFREDAGRTSGSSTAARAD